MSAADSSPRHSVETAPAPTAWQSLGRSLSSFHDEERGDAVQAILIIFVGVIILIALINFFFPDVWNTLKERITTLIEEKS